MNPSKKAEFFNKLSSFFLKATIFSIPFFFLPFVRVPLDVSKGFLFSFGVILSFLAFIIARLVEGSFTLPRTRILAAASLIPVSFIVASILSPNFRVSFWGNSFDVVTGAGSALLFILVVLATSFFKDTNRIKGLYSAFFRGFIFLSIFQIAYIFIPFNQFFAKLFMQASPSLIGGWNDLAIFTGAIVILALMTLTKHSISKGLKRLATTSLVLGLITLVIVNTIAIWIMVGLVALIVFVYTLSFKRRPEMEEVNTEDGDERVFGIAPFIVILVSLFFIMSGATLGARITNMLGTTHTDVRPSIQSTFSVMKSAIAHNPLIGSGPNRFSHAWFMYKPADVNGTVFWDTGFSAGFGLIPTFFVTTGILGILAWLFFFASFIRQAFRPRVFYIEGGDNAYAVSTSLVLSLYFWVNAIIYVPNNINFILAFVMTSVFVGALIAGGIIGERKVAFLNDPRASFFSILSVVVLMILTIITGFIYVQKFSSIVLFNNGTTNINYTAESLDKSEISLLRALELSEQDIYYRALSEVYLYKLGFLLNQGENLSEAVKPELQNILNKSRASAEAAVRFDPTNYFNRISLARVFEALVPLKIEGAYDSARVSYEEALKQNPTNPGIYLSLARLEMANKSNNKAREYIKKALDKKANFVEAVFMLAEIEQSEGNSDEAIKQATQATQIAPNDASVFFQLGLLKYVNKDYTGAVGALERAVLLSPSSLNLHYYLGLAYAKAGRTSDALLQMRAIQKQIPDNEDMKKIIQNLEAGRDPLDGLVKNEASGIQEESAPEAGAQLPQDNNKR